MHSAFRVGVSRDFLKPDGTLAFGDIGLGLLDEAPGVSWEFLAEDTPVLRPEQVADYDALLLLGAQVTAATLAGDGRLSVVARFGVGYDNVDVAACDEHGVLLTITPDGVRRPVASAVIAFVLALSHKLFLKDRLTRTGRWAEKVDHMGMGLVGRTLGVIGLGNIGREVFALARPFDMRHCTCDPFATPEDAKAAGATLMDLDALLRTADFVCVCCPLNPETRGLIGAEQLALMKASAYLINVARGPIVDQSALTTVLRERRIAGAALDVFEREPIDDDDPLLALDNVIVTPHGMSWTDECFRGIGQSACRSILDVAAGRVPRYVANRAVTEHPALQAKLRRYGAQGEAEE